MDQKSEEYNQIGWYLDGKTDFVSFFRGPLLYATEWKDAIKAKNPLTVSANFSLADIIPKQSTDYQGKCFSFSSDKQAHLLVPYFEVEQQLEGTCHASWIRKLD